MKKIYFLLICFLSASLFSCSDNGGGDDYKTFNVTVQVAANALEPIDGIKVNLRDANGVISYDPKETDVDGKVTFNVPAGVYEASATEKRVIGGSTVTYNGIRSNIVVTDGWIETSFVELSLTESQITNLVIKELYTGGVTDNDVFFQHDKYVIIYNNSDEEADLSDLALAMVMPYNATVANRDYDNGELFYAAEGWVPAGAGIWYFTNSVTLGAGEQLVIALGNAVDNTITYPSSINFDNAAYYCTYDPESYSNATSYKPPVASIISSHHMKAYFYGAGNAWPLSISSPAFFLFSLKDITLDGFRNSELNYYGDTQTLANARKKVRNEWVIDAVEVFSAGANNNMKRFPAAIDAGYVDFTNRNGYSLYRNVDVEATMAIEGNEAKLVYNDMSTGTGNDVSKDPSGIDAEASIRNGARIIYKDTNNSSNDFFQRRQASLRD